MNNEKMKICPSCGGQCDVEAYDVLNDEVRLAQCATCQGCGWVPEVWMQTGLPQRTPHRWGINAD